MDLRIGPGIVLRSGPPNLLSSPIVATRFTHRDCYRFLPRAKRGGGGPPKAVEGAAARERFEF